MAPISLTSEEDGYSLLITKELLTKDTQAQFEPYTERIDYISLGDNEVLTTDEIKVKNGKVSLVNNWGKVVLDGSESEWATYYYTAGSGGIRFSLQKDINIKNPGRWDKDTIKANRFTQLDQAQGNQGSYGIQVIGSRFIMRVLETDCTNLTDFKTWLSNHITNVYYQLATPTEVELGYTDLQSIDGENNVEILATLEPTSMKENFIKGE